MKKIVIGITAHVDSGKTTLAEALLYCSGNLRSMGRVDHKDAFLDNNVIERERGITVFSKQACLDYNNSSFTLVDTPGHVDFSAETERTLKVLDYAVLVVSGSEGVQSHTEVIWKLLKDYNVPVFLFVNKMDISFKSKTELLFELKKRFGDGFVDFGEEIQTEELAICNDDLMEEYLNGEISKETIAKAILGRKVFPCIFGSALKNTNVDEFLGVLDEYTINLNSQKDFSARVYKISFDEQGNRLTHLKITGGVLDVKEIVSYIDIHGEEHQDKINQIRIYNGSKFAQKNQATFGELCAVVGLGNTFAGQGLGKEMNDENVYMEPVFNYKVILPEGVDSHKALVMLRRFEEEEPTLRISWNEQLCEIHMRLMGQVQLDVLKRMIHDKFDLDVAFGTGSIAYKETIAQAVVGIGHYEPLRHYAEVHLLLEPTKRGSGLTFCSDCSEDELNKNWQRLILTHLAEKTHIGVLTGSPVTDMKITLLAGRAHLKHTEGGDFRQATYRALRQGLRCAKSVLLEPWYDFVLRIPCECVGRAMNDIEQMHGRVSPVENDGEYCVLKGSAPVSKICEYHTEVAGYSKGAGRLVCSFKGYEECHNQDEVVSCICYDADADLENSADSVFCSHGAGFVVRWDEVSRYAHISHEDNKQEQMQVNTKQYVRTEVTDEELLRIFESTYGPIKRVLHTAMKTQKASHEPKKSKPRKIIQGDEYLLIDGYNIIFAWDELKTISEDNLEYARNRLIDIVCNYQGYTNINVILVFDAYKVKGNKGEIERVHGVDVVYTKEAETADMYIEKVTHKLGKNNRVRVATSDNLEQLIILAGGAVRMSAEEFLKEIKKTENDIREYLRTLE